MSYVVEFASKYVLWQLFEFFFNLRNQKRIIVATIIPGNAVYNTGRQEISYKKGDEPTRKSFSEEL